MQSGPREICSVKPSTFFKIATLAPSPSHTIRKCLQCVPSYRKVLEIGELGYLSWEGRELIAVQDELGEGPALDDVTRQSLQLVALDVEALQVRHSPYLCNIPQKPNP